jgi:hypothetical protein
MALTSRETVVVACERSASQPVNPARFGLDRINDCW